MCGIQTTNKSHTNLNSLLGSFRKFSRCITKNPYLVMTTVYVYNPHCISSHMPLKIRIPANVWNPNIVVPKGIWNSYKALPSKVKVKAKKPSRNKVLKSEWTKKQNKQQMKRRDVPSEGAAQGALNRPVEGTIRQRDCNIKVWRFFFGGFERQLRGKEMSDIALHQPCLRKRCWSCRVLFGGSVRDQDEDENESAEIDAEDGDDEGNEIGGDLYEGEQGLEVTRTREEGMIQNERITEGESMIESTTTTESALCQTLQSSTLSPTDWTFSSPSSHMAYLRFKSHRGRRRYTELARTSLQPTDSLVVRLAFPSDQGQSKFVNLLSQLARYSEGKSCQRSRARHRVALKFMTVRGRARYRTLVELEKLHEVKACKEVGK